MKFALSTLAIAASFVTGCATTGAGYGQQSSAGSDYVAYSAPSHGCGPRYRCISLRPTPVATPTNLAIDDIFNRYTNLVNAGDGMNAATNLNGFFATLRLACRQGESECRDACGRRQDMRNQMNHWNEIASHRFPVGRDSRGINQVITITWDTDIDPLCAAHGNP